MRKYFRMNSLYHKLVASYIIVVILTNIVMGVSSYFLASTNVKREITDSNIKMLEYLKKFVDDTLLYAAEKTYVDLITEQPNTVDVLSLFNVYNLDNYAAVNNAHNSLQNIVLSNRDIIEGIHIYFKNSNVVLSSSTGLKYLEGNNSINTDWLNIMKSSGIKSLWMPTRKVFSNTYTNSEGSNVLSLVRTYPFTASPENSKGFICIDIKESALYNIINQSYTPDLENILIIDKNGNVVSSGRNSFDSKNINNNELLKNVTVELQKETTFIKNFNNHQYVITSMSLSRADWKIIKITPVNYLYRTAYMITRSLIAVCLVSIVLGLIIARIFTTNLYNPIKKLLERISNSFEDKFTLDKNSDNEIGFIDNTISGLSAKLSDLEQLKKANIPIIKHTLITRLAENTLPSDEFFYEKLKMLDVTVRDYKYNSLVIRIKSNALSKIPKENLQILKYAIVDIIENSSLSIPEIKLMAAELSESEIGVLCLSSCASHENLSTFCNKLRNYCITEMNIDLIFFVGEWVSEVHDISESFTLCRSLFRYTFFHPDLITFTLSDFLNTNNVTEKVDETIFDNFYKALRLRNIEKISDIIENFVVQIREKKLSYENANYVIHKLTDLYIDYLKELNLKNIDTSSLSSEEFLKNISDIFHFRMWLLGSISDNYKLLQEKDLNQSAEVINKVKTYIIENLGNDLSLNTVSEKVYLSSAYLSKLFKDETGITYIEFITQKRIEKSRELLLNTNLSIEEISQKVGFNTPHYFTKKFKESFGMTPSTFKQEHLLKK